MKLSFLRSLMVLLVVGVLCGNSGSCTHGAGLDGKKKVLRWSRITKAKTMDPVGQFDQPSTDVINMLYDTLYDYQYLKRPYELQPNLASEMPTYSADGLTMTIPLRTDVKFNDHECFAGGKGRKLVASDVVYSLKRFGDASLNDQSFGMIQGLIVGFDDYRSKTKGKVAGEVKYDDFDISGIQALDDHTIQIKMTKQNTVVKYVLGNAATAIVPRECVEKYGEDFGFNPVGTGPFKVKYKNRLGDLVLVRNPDYFKTYPTEGMPGDAEKGLLKDAGAKLPLLDEVYSPVIQEAQPSMLKFLRGSFDWVAIDADSFSRMAYKEGPGVFKLKDEYAKKYGIYSEPDVGTYWLVFNMKDKLIGSNFKLRKAISMAMNREGFIDDMLNGRGVVVDSVVPPTIAGNHVDTNFKLLDFNVAAAKKLLAEAGFPGGKGLPIIKYTYVSGASSIRQFEYMRRNLAEIGIKFEADLTTYSAMLKKMDEGNFQVGMAGWHADYPDAENFMFWLTTAASSEGQNYSKWSNRTYDALYKEMAGHPDSPERRAVIRKMNEEIARDLPVLPMFGVYRVGLIQPWTQNLRRSLMGDRQIMYLNIDAAAQKKGL